MPLYNSIGEYLEAESGRFCPPEGRFQGNEISQTPPQGIIVTFNKVKSEKTIFRKAKNGFYYTYLGEGSDGNPYRITWGRLFGTNQQYATTNIKKHGRDENGNPIISGYINT